MSGVEAPPNSLVPLAPWLCACIGADPIELRGIRHASSGFSPTHDDRRQRDVLTGSGMFGHERNISPDADRQTQLLAILGREA